MQRLHGWRRRVGRGYSRQHKHIARGRDVQWIGVRRPVQRQRTEQRPFHSDPFGRAHHPRLVRGGLRQRHFQPDRGFWSDRVFAHRSKHPVQLRDQQFRDYNRDHGLSVLDQSRNGRLFAAYLPCRFQVRLTAIQRAAVGRVSNYNVGGIFYPSKYSTAISTNTYGSATAGYSKYTGSQGTGADVIVYDATANAFQHLNTLTGIWTTFTCGNGTNGLTCSGIRASTWAQYHLLKS